MCESPWKQIYQKKNDFCARVRRKITVHFEAIQEEKIKRGTTLLKSAFLAFFIRTNKNLPHKHIYRIPFVGSRIALKVTQIRRKNLFPLIFETTKMLVSDETDNFSKKLKCLFAKLDFVKFAFR